MKPESVALIKLVDINPAKLIVELEVTIVNKLPKRVVLKLGDAIRITEVWRCME